jgi:glutathione synthase/RimK-type ligase-like ATP-grasp enzyme
MGYVTEHRVLAEAARLASERFGLEYSAFSDGWVMRLSKAGAGRSLARFIFGYYMDCNDQAASMIAIDKVATYQLLADKSLAAVPHYLIKSIASEIDIELLKQLFENSPDMVLKPLKGNRGEHVSRHTSADSVVSYAADAVVDAWAVAPYVDMEREIRIVVSGGRPVLAYAKSQAKVINGLAMFNLEHGATPQDITLAELPQDLSELACNAMQAIGLNFGAVDIAIDQQGRAAVLEINSGFSMERYARSSPERRQATLEVYVTVIGTMFGF